MAESLKDESLHYEVQLKSKADKVADIFRNQCNLFPTIMPLDAKTVTKIKAYEWLWTFIDDKCGSWKYSVKASGETEPITWTLVDGAVPKNSFDSLHVVYQFSPNNKGCMAIADLHFDRKNALVPTPTDYIEFIGNMFKAVDEYLQTPKH